MTNQTPANRRTFLKGVAAASAGVTLGGCSGSGGASAGGGQKPLRALCSNAGLESTWCELGKKTMELWGGLLNVEVTWVDGAFSSETQRNGIENRLSEEWDFCCFQAVQAESLAEPCKRLKERDIPVISMDTLIVELDKARETGVWSQVQPDQVWMGEQSSRYLLEKIGGEGTVIHIGGDAAHSGAQGRAQGFENVLADFPKIEVAGGGVRWCDWKVEKARNTFESLIQTDGDKIKGAFFHSDDMALACIEYLKENDIEDMVVTAVDGQKDKGLAAVQDGTLDATTVNPVCRIHKTALVMGQFIVRNKEPLKEVPLEVVTPGPFLSAETPRMLEAMIYLSDEDHCMV